MGKLDDAVPQVQAQESMHPVRPITHQSDVTVPLFQATAIGVLVTVPLCVALYGLTAALSVTLPPELWAALALVALCGVTLWAFLWRLGIVTETLQHRVETALNVDLDSDGSVGAHAAVIGRTVAERDDPIQREKVLLRRFVDACYSRSDGSGASTRALRNAGFSDAEIDRCRDVLLRAGVAAWSGRNHKNGIRLVVGRDQAVEITGRLAWLPNGKAWQE